MRILVVGGAGYIGSHAARALRRHGYEAILYDNLSTGHRVLATGFDLVVGDIGDQDRLRAAMEHADAIMHFAALTFVGESVQNPRKYFHNNVEGALALLNTALDAGKRTVVFSSSCAVYGTPARVPIREDLPREPINPYGVTKLFFEHALEAYRQAYGLRYASLRYFNAAGADESAEIGELHDPETHLIPLALAAATPAGAELAVYGNDYPTPDGTCVRDYIHVNDLAEAHVIALRQLLEGGDSMALNLGTGQGHSVLEVIAAVEAATGSKVKHRIAPRRPGDPPVLVADAGRAERQLGWKATRGLPEIVGSAWKWMQQAASRPG